jgi:hypothetical protein
MLRRIASRSFVTLVSRAKGEGRRRKRRRRRRRRRRAGVWKGRRYGGRGWKALRRWFCCRPEEVGREGGKGGRRGCSAWVDVVL